MLKNQPVKLFHMRITICLRAVEFFSEQSTLLSRCPQSWH